MNFIRDIGGEDDEIEEMDGVCEDVVTLFEGCVISTNETTTILRLLSFHLNHGLELWIMEIVLVTLNSVLLDAVYNVQLFI